MKIYNLILEKMVMPAGDLLFSTKTMDELKKWRQISQLSESELSNLQKENLSNLLKFAVQEIPFYKELRTEADEDPFIWIKKFPVMKKKDYKENIDLLLSEDKEKLIKKMTSGSSGIQGITYMNVKEQDVNRAIQMLWWEWAGWKPGKPILQTGMTIKRGLLKTFKDYFLRTTYSNAFGMSETSSAELMRKFRNRKNYHIGGYASSIYLLAKIAEKEGFKDIRFDGAISWGDKMFPHFRSKIKEVFGCKVYDTYACSEGLMIASQHDLDYYYIMTPHIYLELLDKEGNDVEDGQLGHVVVTRLDSRSMPIIRYYTGDLAVRLPRNQYPASRKFAFPLLEKVIGRDTDIVYTQSNKFMIVHFFTGIFEFETGITQFRVVQENLDSMKIEYIPSEEFDELVLSRIEKKIHDHLHEAFPIEWVKVDEIPSTASGKPQIIKSLIK